MSRATLLPALIALVLAVFWVEMRGGADGMPRSPSAVGEADLERLARRIEALEGAPAPAPRITERRAGPEEAPPPPEPLATAQCAGPLAALLERVAAGTATEEEIGSTWEILLKASPREIANAVEAFRRRVSASPRDADAHYGLGLALSATYTATEVTEAQMMSLGMKADACFTRAIELDDHHFGARFSKAMTYALCPPNFGLGPDAIHHFEVLVEQYGGDPGREDMQEVYYNLGKEHAKLGNFERAADCYREGLSVFPQSRAMRAELEVMEDR